MSPRRLAILATGALALLPFAFMAPALLRGDVPTGSTGLFPLDQLQYMALIQEAGHFHHVLDHFPIFLVSGLLTRLGLGVRTAFLLWIPVSLFVLVVGFDRYIRALIVPARARAATLALSLFYCSPAMAAIYWIDRPTGDSLQHLIFTGDYLFPAGSAWGYPQIAIALGLMPVCFLAVTSDHAPRWAAAAAGAVVSFMHPWQGVTVVVVHALAALSSRALRNLRMLLAMVCTGAPLAYYWAVERTDARFEITRRNTAIDTAPPWVLAAILVPLALAVLGAARSSRTRPRDQQLLYWPLAAFFAYGFVDASWKPYFLLGITLPLAVLAVRAALAFPALARPAVAAAALVVLTLPGIVCLSTLLRKNELGEARGAYLLKSGDARALGYIADAPRPGSVLTGGFLAPAAWALTGRDSYAASPLTDPEYLVGIGEAKELLAGELSHATARRFARRTGAAFVMSGCDPRGPDLRPWLGSLVLETRRFGCAAVYELRPR